MHFPNLFNRNRATTAVETRSWAPRWWLVFPIGLALWIATVATAFVTLNLILLPTVVLLGSFLIPVTGVVWYLDHDPSPAMSPRRIFAAFIIAGVMGALAASLLEFWLVYGPGLLGMLKVGLIEEFVKGVAIVAFALGLRSYATRDGVVLGATVGFGFAALESSGYAPVTPPLPAAVYAANTAADFVDVSIRTDRLEIANRVVEAMERWIEGQAPPWAHVAAHRGRALLSTGDGASTEFEAALSISSQNTHGFDLAQTRLQYGEWLRRQRFKTEARRQLNVAPRDVHRVGRAPVDGASAGRVARDGSLARR